LTLHVQHAISRAQAIRTPHTTARLARDTVCFDHLHACGLLLLLLLVVLVLVLFLG
jgi:hypothetical protein